MTDHHRPDLSGLADRWPSNIVARSQVGEFTGGAVSPGTIANADAAGTGPEGAFYIGRRRVYTVQALIHWLEAQASTRRRLPVRRIKSTARECERGAS